MKTVKLVYLSLIMSFLASCQLVDTKVQGGFHGSPSVGGSAPLTIDALNDPVSIHNSIQINASGGHPPYAYSIVSGGGAIDSGTGVYTSSWVKGDVTLNVTDAEGASEELSFSVEEAQLTAPVTASSYNDFGSGRFADNGNTLIYRGDPNGDGIPELWSVQLDGSGSTQLNGGAGRVQSFQVTEDGQWVVFREEKSAGKFDLYLVKPDGSGLTKISNISVDDSVSNYSITPDSSSVVYTVNDNAATRENIFSSSFASPSEVKLNSTMQYLAGISTFKLIDSNKVAYTADQNEFLVKELFVADIGVASSSIRVSGDYTGSITDVKDFEITSDKLKLVFRANVNTPASEEILSVNIDGSNLVQLNSSMAGDADTILKPVGPSTVFYVADQDTSSKNEVYSATIGTASSSVKVGATNAGAGAFPGVAIGLSSTYDEVLYLIDHEIIAQPSYYHAVAGVLDNKVKVNGPYTNHLPYIIKVNDTFTEVIYLADEANPNTKSLFHATFGITGGTEIIPAFPPTADVVTAKVTDDFSKVVFIADLDTDNQNEVYSINLDGTNLTKLNLPLVSGGNVTNLNFTPDGLGVIYWADQEADDRVDLYYSPFDASQNIKLNNIYSNSASRVSDLKFTPDGSKLLIEADAHFGGVQEIFSFGIPW